ncbi:DUF4097 family beta strand repeat-containing protein [Kitasatospora sp. HPMI-4]|uniref:DUF4097 family beta strand repeat-containing protein n=1 Tax=Kitasatospora sp. HPMI-4 TaxID=3448443 RepID=UPI003F1DB384
MRQRLRYPGILAVAAIATAGLSACDALPGQTFEDDGSLREKITSVRLDMGAGSVVLHGRDGGGGLPIHRKVEYRGDRPTGATYRIEDGVLVLNGCGDHCSVSYTVDVPAGVPVTGGTSAGSISLSGVGEVTVTTDSGGVELDGVSGPVNVRTSNGRISGRGLKGGRIQVQTSNGAIDLAPAVPQNVQAKTSNGKIDLTVPAARYKVSTKTNAGGRHIGVTDDPAGTYQLDLTTSNGDITVKSS